VDLFEKKGILVQTGNRLKYIDKTGKEHIDFRKAWIGDKLDMLMADFKESTDFAGKEVVAVPEEVVAVPEVIETKPKAKTKKAEPIIEKE
jgi:hypothetical protein